MAWITNRNKLTLTEMQNNATEFYGIMSSYGWSLNSISGMLGDIQWESSINPGVVEGFVSTNPPNKGYGLIQWTNSKATNVHNNPLWAWTYATYGDYNWDNGDRQCTFINGDDASGWIPVPAYPLTYEEFKVSTETPQYLAKAYFYNRERGTWFDARATSADYWFEYLSGKEPPDPPDPPDPPEPEKKRKRMPIYMYPAFRY